MNSAIIGLVMAVLIGTFAVLSSTDNYFIYWNLLGIFIVIGGTLSAAAIAYSIKDIFRLFSIFIRVFRRSPDDTADIIDQIVNISISRSRGQYTSYKSYKDNTVHPFILDGLKLIDNEFNHKQVGEIMTSAAVERRNVFMQDIEILSTLAKYPPAFGMIGTVLGLVALLNGLGGAEGASKIGPNMSVALLTTLYGLLIANYVFIPMTDNLLNRLKTEMQVRKVIIRGILLIEQADDPFVVQETLQAYLIPSKRKGLNSLDDDAPILRAS